MQDSVVVAVQAVLLRLLQHPTAHQELPEQVDKVAGVVVAVVQHLEPEGRAVPVVLLVAGAGAAHQLMDLTLVLVVQVVMVFAVSILGKVML